MRAAVLRRSERICTLAPLKIPGERRVLATTASFFFAALVGTLGGVLAVGFQTLVDLAQRAVTGRSGSFVDAARELPWWACVILPALGGVVAALIIRSFSPRAKPFGISGIMEAVSVRRRRIKGRPIVTRAVASVAVIASGGSVGREGPIVQLAAAFASKVARVAKFDPARHSLLLGCGVAAGMAAAYNAPLAGAFFVGEVILASFAIEIFAPIVVSSVFAALSMRAIRGSDAAAYTMPSDLSIGGFGPVLLTLALGLVAGVVAVGFQRSLRAGSRVFARLAAPLELKLALAGLVVGLIGTQVPEVFGNGYAPTSEILNGRLALGTIVLVFLAKPVATALSVGSGAPGGVFTPALLCGASLGALFAASVARLFPSLDTPAAAFAVVGMASLVAGLTHAPIMSMVLILELTHDFGLILPLVLATVASALVARWLARDSIFTESLRARGVPIDVGIEELTLRRIRVRDLVRSGLLSVPRWTPLADVLRRFRETRLDVIYVVGEEGELQGLVDLHDVKEFLNREPTGPTRVASDVMQAASAVTPEMSLAEVMPRFDDPELEELPVIETQRGRPVLAGRLTRRDVIAAIHLEVVQNQARRTRLMSPDDGDVVELPAGYEIAELDLPQRWRAGTLEATGVTREKGVTVLSLVERDGAGVKRRVAEPNASLVEVDSLVVVGKREDIQALRERVRSGN
ncbi:MAG: chloride channel protein [Planctomycetes bacterium]|nr:chloride channel protein [Planctomycetota bacterium]